MISAMKPELNVLLLGMGYASDQITNEFEGTSNPYVRDVHRIKALEKLGMHVHTINMQLKPEESSGFPEHPRHIQLYWTGGKRAVKQSIDQFPEEQFKHIFLDYFRFPSEYMRQAYTMSLFKDFILDGLKEYGYLTDDFDIIAPNNEAIVPILNKCTALYDIERISDDANKLWVATEALYRDGYIDGGNYSNSEQLASSVGYLDKDCHFVRMTPKIV
eukprot:CFRG2440T1